MQLNLKAEITETSAYKIGALQEKYQQLIQEGMDIINCTIGDPKDDTPKTIRTSLLNSIQKMNNSQYPSYIGRTELRKSISESLNKEYSTHLDPETMIISCNGTKEAIYSFPQLFDWSNNKYVSIPSLSYPVYLLSAKYNQIPFQIINVSKETNFLPDLSKIDVEKTQLLWINSPHNPTTTIASYEYLNQLIELAEKNNFIICSDECYNDLYYDEKPTSILEFESEHWVCFRSLSKRSHMTGYRSGAVISKNKELIKHLKKFRSPMGVGTPSFIQDSAITAWGDHDHVIQHRANYKNKRDKILSAFNKLDLDYHGATAGFYLWLSSPNHQSSESLADWFLKKGILVTPGTVFGPDGNPYIRMVYCLSDDMIDKVCTHILK